VAEYKFAEKAERDLEDIIDYPPFIFA